MIDSVGDWPDTEGAGRREESATDRAALRYVGGEEADEDRPAAGFGRVDETLNPLKRRVERRALLSAPRSGRKVTRRRPE